MRFHNNSSSYYHYACTIPTMLVLCLLFLCYAYYACTMPTIPIYNYHIFVAQEEDKTCQQVGQL